MNTQERQIIDDLFDKLRQVEQQAGPREPNAETHIRSRIERQPGAPYYMAQTIVMQEQALQTAQARIAELEDELARRPAGGGFLSGLFGGGSQPQPRPPQRQPDNMQGMAPPGGGFGSGVSAPGMAAQPGRGGFLAGAAQTAMGVAGGVVLGSLLGNALGGGGEAKVAEAAQPTPAAQPAAASGDDDFGGDLGGDFSEDI
jgi:uncharacterized protein